jgi:hypothetical protein
VELPNGNWFDEDDGDLSIPSSWGPNSFIKVRGGGRDTLQAKAFENWHPISKWTSTSFTPFGYGTFTNWARCPACNERAISEGQMIANGQVVFPIRCRKCKTLTLAVEQPIIEIKAGQWTIK